MSDLLDLAKQFHDSCTEAARKHDKDDMRKKIAAKKTGDRAWPIKSVAFGVPPKYIEKAKKADAARGVKVEYTPGGRAIFTSQAHQNEVLKAHGAHNNDY